MASSTAAGEPGIVSTTTLPTTPPDGAAEHRGRTDLVVAEHAEQLAIAGQRLGQEPADRLEGLVALSDAGAAADQDGVDCCRFNEAIQQPADRGRFVGHDLPVDHLVSGLGQEVDNQVAASVSLVLARIADGDDGTADARGDWRRCWAADWLMKAGSRGKGQGVGWKNAAIRLSV